MYSPNLPKYFSFFVNGVWGCLLVKFRLFASTDKLRYHGSRQVTKMGKTFAISDLPDPLLHEFIECCSWKENFFKYSLNIK